MKFLRRCATAVITAAVMSQPVLANRTPADYVDPFIGTSNFGATHPGAQVPHGLASVSPFNVAFGYPQLNEFEKDEAWNSRVYIHENQFFTGFSHLNLSGVGCPEAGVINLMPTSGDLSLAPEEYGSTFSDQQASAGLYNAHIDKYDIDAEVTSTARAGISRFRFSPGRNHIVLNLGLALTNETGASIRQTSPTEFVGSRTLGTFCYNPEDVRPVYFVMQLSDAPDQAGVWKQMPAYKNVEADWVAVNDDVKTYPDYPYPLHGDNIGAWASYNADSAHTVSVKIGISFVSIANARKNLEQEIPAFDFNSTRRQAKQAWNDVLQRVQVEGQAADKTRFYTALYHTLIHPSIFSDINGDYPITGGGATGNASVPRYTVYSLWDTSRNVHPLLSLLYPRTQSAMMRSAIAMGRESGWLPKWELYGMETNVMVGDPGTVMMADSYLRGIQDVDIDAAYKMMVRAATQADNNLLRPDAADYLSLGYVPYDDEGPYDGSVSTSLEYYQADFALSRLAAKLDKPDDAARFANQAQEFTRLFDPATGMLRPKNRKGEWLSPFDPELGKNFEPAPGYIEGNAWNYRFYVPHGMQTLIEKLGGPAAFEAQLDKTFATDNFDMANEPDITYPYLYLYTPGGFNKASNKVAALRDHHFTTEPGGIPGNDDTGTMSAWLAFSMMGIYPLSPGEPSYAMVSPAFDRITISLDDTYYPGETLTIRRDTEASRITFNGRPVTGAFIAHQQLIQGGTLVIPAADTQE
ncbi:GH92 family glycosyl hydrolase [Alteromonas halophila]|uniref:Alpha-1 2-mannosidase n=1 Tax=Alteromonas halophila TaxID=516698 RepID=A0A918MZE6_9ALTE|nr:GH92 family glycosyl hydrolase [Alteromonas halophila]GGW84871.1 alpha-1 2-mannosidase [Alteromonas halophila]